MARPRKTPSATPVGSPAGTAPDGEVSPGDALFKWDSAEQARVRIDRTDDRSKKLVFHGYLGLEEATEARVADLFGGGAYRAQLTSQDALRGSWFIRATKFFEVPGAYKPPLQLPGVSSPKPEQAAAAAGVVGDVRVGGGAAPNDVLQTALVTQLLDIMKQTKSPAGPVASVDWGPILIAAIGVLPELFAARRESASGRDPALTALAQQIQSLSDRLEQLQRAPSPGSVALTDQLGSLRELAGLARMLAGKRGDDDDDEDAGDPTTKMLGKVIDMFGPRLGAGTPAPGNAVAPTGGALTHMPPVVAALRMYGPSLVGNAEEGNDPNEVAQSIEGMIPARYLPDLRAFVHQPTATAQVMQLVPALTPYAEWTQALVVSLRSRLPAESGS